MKKMALLSVVAMWAAAVVVGALIAGCETGGDTGIGLTVVPSFVDLSVSTTSTNSTTNTTITQTFTVETNGLRSLSLPLEWSVSDTNLGMIGASGGYSASYVRTSVSNHGDNAITVEDQYGAKGVATVRQ
jgi:hypothetical protein